MTLAPALPTTDLRSILLILFAMLLFGSMDTFSKSLVQHYPAPFVLWVRHLIALPLVLAILLPRHPLAHLRSRRPWLQIGRSVLLVVEMAIIVYIFRTMPLADVHALIAVTPLVVTALSVPLLGEQVGWRRWAAVCFGFLGVLVILRPGLTVVQPEALIVLLCVAMYGLYTVWTRLIARYDPPDTSFIWQMVVAVAVLTAVAPLFWVTPRIEHLPLVLGLGLFGAVGHYCLVRAYAMAPAVMVQPFTYTLLVWATVFGYLVFGDFPDAWTIMGAVMVVLAGIYTAWREYVRAHQHAQEASA